MISFKKILEEGLKCFPSWSDIRKRYDRSNGGIILSNIASEIEELNIDIEEYIDMHFISNYKDKCDYIIDYVYRVNIGIIDIKEIEIINPDFEVIQDFKMFLDNKDKYILYEDGFLISANELESITYKIKDSLFTSKLNKINIWNIYDEFALLINIKRYDDETNKELLNRIIRTSKNPINSAKKGLKESIISAVINDIPELNEDMIEIETINDDNLNTVNSLTNNMAINELAEINRDVLINKQWDIDKWHNSFKQIKYKPHEWDTKITKYENGIGDNDDLKPVLIDGKTTTDAKIAICEESTEQLEKYIKANPFQDNIDLKVYKYANDLKKITADYSIKASEALELKSNNEDIIFETYKSTVGKHIRNIEDIVIEEENKNILVSDNSKLLLDMNYRFEFKPSDDYSPVEIERCSLINNGIEVKNFLLDNSNPNFRYENNKLIPVKNSKIINRVHHLEKYNNILESEQGIYTDNISEQSNITFNIDNCENKNMKLLFDTNNVFIEDHNIEKTNFYYIDDSKEYVSDTIENEEKILTINKTCNEISFEIANGQSILTVIVDGEIITNTQISSANKYYRSPHYNTPKSFEVIISNIGSDITIIKNLKYKNYEIQLRTDNSRVLKVDDEDNYILPNEPNNRLHINFRTYTQYPIYISKIFIGDKCNSENDIFITDNELIPTDGDYTIEIKANCKISNYHSIETIEDFSSDKIIKVEDYNTSKNYIALDNDSFLMIDLKEYSEIKNIVPVVGSYESISNNYEKYHIIKMKSGQEINSIEIDGFYHTLLRKISLKNIMESKVKHISDNDRFYCTLLTHSVIRNNENEQVQELYDISKNDFIDNINEISLIKIINLPENIQSSFITLTDQGEYKHKIIDSKIETYFDIVHFYPKKSKEYIAHNQSDLLTREKTNIDIVNTFNNGYIDNQLMFYEISSLNKGIEVLFNGEEIWSLFKRTIDIKLLDDYNNENFNIINKSAKVSKIIEKITILDQVYMSENNEYINISEFLLDDNETFKVNYNSNMSDKKYIKEEIVDITNKEYIKLKYSNVITIISIMPLDNLEKEIDSSMYSVLFREGIVLISDTMNKIYDKIKIKYQIKIPISLEFNNEYLYKKINYSIKAFRVKKIFFLSDIQDKDTIDLKTSSALDEAGKETISSNYDDKNIIYVECNNKGFNCTKVDSTLVFNKIYNENMIAVKNGWYYIYGKEYYMFATDDSYKIIQDEDIEFYEVDKTDSVLLTHKKTNNYIKNSKMNINAISNVYSIDNFNELKAISGVSSMNSLTACDTYNHWTTFALDLHIKDGLNGYGLEVIPNNNKNMSFAYLKITDFLFESNYISIYNPNKVDIYIGRGLDGNNEKTLMQIEYISEMVQFVNKYDDICYQIFKYDKNYNYYLVVKPKSIGLIDDIIIQDGNNPATNVHVKNIDILNICVEEKAPTNTIVRIPIENEYGNISVSSEINNNGYIVNNANVDWNYTKIKSYYTEKDWLSNFELYNVDVSKINDTDCAVVTSFTPGRVKTRPIYIGDPKIINKILYKINDINIDTLNGFECKLYQSKTINGNYTPCSLNLSSKSCLNYTNDVSYEYIQLEVDIQSNKVINNIEIFVEYKSDKYNAPIEKISTDGVFITKVLNSYATNNYTLKDIGIIDMIGTCDIYIRASKENSNTNVWTDWKKIEIDEDNKIIQNIHYAEYKYFQLKINLKGKDTKIKIDYIELEVTD